MDYKKKYYELLDFIVDLTEHMEKDKQIYLRRLEEVIKQSDIELCDE